MKFSLDVIYKREQNRQLMLIEGVNASF